MLRRISPGSSGTPTAPTCRGVTSAAAGGSNSHVMMDVNGRLTRSPSTWDGEIGSAFARLLCADLSLLGSRTAPTATGHLGVLTLKEWTGRSLEFWAGAALRADESSALCDAAYDALLAPWGGSVIVAGAARLVANGTCRGAMVSDDTGVTTFGPVENFPPLGEQGATPEPGARLAVCTPAGDFHVLSLGAASVMLLITPGWTAARRVEEWFDVLDDALGGWTP